MIHGSKSKKLSFLEEGVGMSVIWYWMAVDVWVWPLKSEWVTSESH